MAAPVGLQTVHSRQPTPARVRHAAIVLTLRSQCGQACDAGGRADGNGRTRLRQPRRVRGHLALRLAASAEDERSCHARPRPALPARPAPRGRPALRSRRLAPRRRAGAPAARYPRLPRSPARRMSWLLRPAQACGTTPGGGRACRPGPDPSGLAARVTREVRVPLRSRHRCATASEGQGHRTEEQPFVLVRSLPQRPACAGHASSRRRRKA
jgi:hypothetical protein